MVVRAPRKPPTLLNHAVSLLARREYSRAELERRLERYLRETADDDRPEATIVSVLDQLERRNLLSDQRYAASRLRTRAERFGDARLRHDLREHGVPDAAASQAMAVMGGDELSRARALWQRRFGQLPANAAERARQGRFLQSRGFALDTIRRVLRGPAADES